MEGYHKLNSVSRRLEQIMIKSDRAKHDLQYAQLMLWTEQNAYATEWIRHIWLSLGEYGMSQPETIRRCWQKNRENHPEWKETDKTFREESEKEFRDYARQ